MILSFFCTFAHVKLYISNKVEYEIDFFHMLFKCTYSENHQETRSLFVFVFKKKLYN
jgi:hypothetical protein